jgi:putative transposase
MEDHSSLSHSKWQCKYHVVFIPKYRKKKLYGAVKRRLGEVFHRLAQQKECWIEEGHIMPDHVHMLINVPPKLAVSSVVGYIKGKSAIHVARHCCPVISPTASAGYDLLNCSSRVGSS